MWGIAAAASSPGVVIAAAEAASNGIDVSQIITAGVTPAAVLLLILTGKLYPSGIVEAYRKRAETAEAKVELLQTQMMDRVVPSLTLSTQVLQQIQPILIRIEANSRDVSPPARPSPR